MINDIVEQVKLNPNQIPIPTTYRRNIEKVLSYAISFYNSFRFPLCEKNQIITLKLVWFTLSLWIHEDSSLQRYDFGVFTAIRKIYR